ncbi:MAG TPA: tetratricopeptide repeat protein [Haloferula sp.]
MKALLPLGGSIALMLMAAACKKPETQAAAPAASAPESPAAKATGEGKAAEAKEEAGQGKAGDRSQRAELSVKLNAAQNLFAARNIAATLKALDEVPEEFRGDPGFLTLRGACYTEQRDFKAALEDFKEAAKKKPGDPSIRFNVAEISFVLHEWEEAIKGFQVLQSQGATKGEVGALVDFKLMLCEEGRGNAAEFDRRATENLTEADSILAGYTKAAMEFRSGQKDEARVTLAEVEKNFPERSARAPWYDTMVEFGYLPGK